MQGIFIGVVAAFVICITIVGPECVYLFGSPECVTRNHASHFEQHKTAFQEGAGHHAAIVVNDEKGTDSFEHELNLGLERVTKLCRGDGPRRSRVLEARAWTKK